MRSRFSTLGCTLVCTALMISFLAPSAVVIGDDGANTFDRGADNVRSYDIRTEASFAAADSARAADPGNGPVETGNDYQLDDGTAEASIGTGTVVAVMWLTQYNVVAGLEVITDVNVGWGAVPNGTNGTVVLYSDPNGDGDPADGALLASLAVVVSDAGTSVVNKYNTPDTLIGAAGTSFFVGAAYQQAVGDFPARQDNTAPVFGRNWIGFGTPAVPPATWDLVETVGATPPSLAGNWMVRANAIAATANCGNTVCEAFENCDNCPADCGGPCVCGDGTQDPGEECDPGGILGAPPDDTACPGTCLSDCTCSIAACTATCPVGAIDEAEACGADVNGGCNSGTCVGDGLPCIPLAQDCAVGQGPCNASPAAFTPLGSLATGASVDACGNDWADGATRDTDWYEVTIVDSDADGWADVTVTLTSEIPTAAFLISGATGDCSAIIVQPDIALSDDCISDTFTACMPVGTYTVFAGTGDAIGSLFDGFPCTALEAPFDYNLTVSVANATCEFCGNGICAVGEECTCVADCGAPLTNEGMGTCNDGIDNDCDLSTDCFDPDCFGVDGCPATPIPTMTEWGLMVMTVLLLAAGTIVFARRRRTATA